MSQQDPMLASVLASAKERDALIASNKESNVSANIASVVQGGVNLLTEKKKQLKQFNKQVLQEEQRIYDKVGGFVTEYESFNEKQEAFFDGLISQYNEIKTHLDNGTMKDASLGKRDLASIKNLIDQYGRALPNVMASADAITEAANKAGKDGMGAPGTLSVTGAPTGQLAILKKIATPGPSGQDIEMRNEGGAIILYDTKTGAELNIREFNDAISNGQNPYLKFVPDLSKGMTNAYNAFNKNPEGENVNTFTEVVEDPNAQPGDGEIRRMSEANEIKLKEALMGTKRYDYTTNTITNYRDGGAYKEMINQFGESIWEDMMPDGLKNKPQWPEQMPMFGDTDYDEFYENFYKPTLEYLATTTINNNTKDIQRETQATPENRKKLDDKYKQSGGSKEYEAKLDEFFKKADMSEADQAKVKKAKPGEAVSVVIYGKQQTFIKDA